MFGFKARRIAKLEAKWAAEAAANAKAREEFFAGMSIEEQMKFIGSEAHLTRAYWESK